MGGQAAAAVAAAEAVLQEATTAVAKQLQRAIPEAQNLFSEEDAGPAHSGEVEAEAEASQEGGSAQPSESEDSDGEVHCPFRPASCLQVLLPAACLKCC